MPEAVVIITADIRHPAAALGRQRINSIDAVDKWPEGENTTSKIQLPINRASMTLSG